MSGWVSRTGVEVSEKPKKPRKDFPLFAHANGSWVKKIKGKQVSFGPWGKGKTKAEQARLAKAAEKKYKERVRAADAGREPDDARLGDVLDRFVADQRSRLETDQLSKSRFNALRLTCLKLAELLGRQRKVADITPDDFTQLNVAFRKNEAAPKTYGEHIINTKRLFEYARQQHWISRPVEFGMNFRGPTRREMAAYRRRKKEITGDLDWQPGEIREQLRLAGDARLKAIILVCINCAMTLGEVNQLRFSDFDDDGWLDTYRPKTEGGRRGKLWPRTLEAIRDYADGSRIAPAAQYNDFVFTTQQRQSMSKRMVGEALKALYLRIGQYREGVGSRGYRNAFATIGVRVDTDATKLMMGQQLGDVLHVHYVQEFPRERMQKVADTVERAIFGEESKKS